MEHGPGRLLPLRHLTASSILLIKLLFLFLETAEETGAQRDDITGLRNEGEVGLEAVGLAQSPGGLCPWLYATSLACTSCMTPSESLSYSETQSPHL